MKLYLFNPDADMALADFSENYMPPALIRQMAVDLALLPLWWAEQGAGVVAASAYNQSYLQRWSQQFPLPAQLLTPPELAAVAQPDVLPWGWSPAVRKWLLKQGIAASALPSLSALAKHRQQAGKQTALAILDSFRGIDGCCGQGSLLHTLAACEDYWRSRQGRCLFKAPWSGSGKGLLWCYSDFSASVSGWCRRVLSEQQVLIGMPIYNKVYDFAMEFWMDGSGNASFIGYSLFHTTAKGAYQGNVLMSDAAIEQLLSAAVPSASLPQIRRQLQVQLPMHYPGYRGYLGVDMMVCRMADGHSAVFPCVEVNLRMNMGIVAHQLAHRFLLPGSRGRFSVEVSPSPHALQASVSALQAAFPPQIVQGKLLSGYLPLVPVSPQSRYMAYIHVEPLKNVAADEDDSIIFSNFGFY